MKSSDYLKSLIYVVRGVKVMLDADLAVLYGYTTRTFNQQVKNNIVKFDDDFRFQLTKEEYEHILRSKNLTAENNITIYLPEQSDNQGDLMSKNLTSSWGGNRKLPYAFTEQGIYMLMTVLKGELATQQSKALIRAFKDYNTKHEKIYHCGASSKDAGKKVNTIIEVSERQIYHPIVDKLLNNPLLSL